MSKSKNSRSYYNSQKKYGSMSYATKKELIHENFICSKWSVSEHRTFIIGILLYDNDWEDIQKLIRTISKKEVLFHCQKFFLKLRKLKFLEKIFYWAKKVK